MANEASGWTVLFRDGAPATWPQAAQQVVRAGGARFTLGDATRAVRFGQGFLALLLEAEEAARIEQALTEDGLTVRALRWSDCEAAEPPVRYPRVALDSEEVVPGLPWKSVHYLHLVRAESAPFFLPPEANEATKSAHRVAGVVGLGVEALGLDDFGVAQAVKQATGQAMSPGAATNSAPELVVELCGLWAPRVHLPVDTFEYGCVPEARGGRRERLGKLLEALLARAPGARPRGLVEEALARKPLDSHRPVPSSDHRRLVMGWLTSLRLWPPPARERGALLDGDGG